MVTRREQLAEQFAAMEKTEEKPAVEVEKVEAAPEERQERARDEAGKFVKAEETKPEKKEETPVEDKYVKPPKSWKQEYLTHYSGLAPEVRAYLHQREDEQNRGVAPLMQRAQRLEAIERALGPVGQHLNDRGVPLDGFLRDISRTVWVLANGTPDQKRAEVLNIARSYGVEMAQQAAAAAAAQPTQADPRLHKVEADLQSLRQERQREIELREQAEWDAAAGAIAQIETDVEKYPHFAAVKVTMGRLIQAGEANSLHDAYTKAVRLNEDVWSQEQARLQVEADTKRKADQAAAAKAARAAAVSPRTASPTGGQVDNTGGKKGRREALMEAIDRHLGAGRV